ncbi:MAG: HD domain-containing protein [Lachnospiraceae bacterium]|nr:HD domain-containing protein [Lachnospiraceae bacterium]
MSVYSVYCLVCLILSAVGTLIFIIRYTNQLTVHFPCLFLLIPLAEVGYFMLSMSSNLEEALLATKITYLGGCFIQPMTTFSILTMCKINLRKPILTVFYASTMLLCGFAMTIGFNKIFYISASFHIDPADGGVILDKHYGVVHMFFYIVIILHTLAGIAILLYALISKRKNVSTTTIGLYVAIEVIGLSSYFISRKVTPKLELMAAIYVLTELILMIMISYMRLYNIAVNSAEAYEKRNTNGFITFDRKMRYIGANAAALKIYPELADVRINTRPDITKSENFAAFDKWLTYISQTKVPSDFDVSLDDHFYNVNVNLLKYRSKTIGYSISLEDTTQNRVYTHLLEDYNHKLNEEVAQKTEHIKEMQDKAILTFAEMVENRDSSTGGHIKRSSQGVRFITSKMQGDRKDATPEFCSALMNAAPMHDIGRIAIPDVILQKVGRYESWEYEIMKKHAEKGAEIIHKAFEFYDDTDFRRIAENIAHYHHERWDGDGYPMGLSGSDIPLEARVMSIADVYDALVSKRTYRERLSFEEAYNTIMDGMGKQFDPSLAKYFAASRSELENYYSQLGE